MTVEGRIDCPEDLRHVETILRRLTGEPLLAARTSYGDELRLHFGKDVRPNSGVLVDRPRGEWILGARASPWYLTGRAPLVSEVNGAADVSESALALASLVGAKVVHANVAYPSLDLEVAFEVEVTFVVASNSEGDDLPAWELFTSDRRVLSMGPGRQWDLVPADSPGY